MIIDLTTKVSEELEKKLLEKEEDLKIAAGHLGTHLDTYLKSDIPLKYFKCRGILIDATIYPKNYNITTKDISNINIQKGDFVIFRTDYGNIGYGTSEYFLGYPELSQEVIQLLCDKKISFIGVDAAGIRKGDEHVLADKLCEEQGVYVIENLCNLDKITKENFEVYTLWFDDVNATGLRCRVLCEE